MTLKRKRFGKSSRLPRSGGNGRLRQKQQEKKQARMMSREAPVPVSMFSLPAGTHPNDRANRERVAQVVKRMTGCEKVAVRLVRNERGQTLTDTYYVSPGASFVSLAGLDDDQAELVADIIDGIAQDEDVTVELEDLADTIEESDEEDAEGEGDEGSSEEEESEEDEEFDPEEQFGKGSRRRRSARRGRRKAAQSKYYAIGGSTWSEALPADEMEPWMDPDTLNIPLTNGDEIQLGSTDVVYESGEVYRDRGADYSYEGDATSEALDLLEFNELDDDPSETSIVDARKSRRTPRPSLAKTLGISSKDANLIRRAIRGKSVKEASRVLASGRGLPFKVRTAKGQAYTLREVREIVRLAGQKRAESSSEFYFQPEMDPETGVRNLPKKYYDAGFSDAYDPNIADWDRVMANDGEYGDYYLQGYEDGFSESKSRGSIFRRRLVSQKRRDRSAPLEWRNAAKQGQPAKRVRVKNRRPIAAR